MAIPASVRRMVLERDNWTCWYCGRYMGEWFKARIHLTLIHIEHQIPSSRGGTDDPSNLVTACRACNSRKCGRTVEEYRVYAQTGRFYGELTRADLEKNLKDWAQRIVKEVIDEHLKANSTDARLRLARAKFDLKSKGRKKNASTRQNHDNQRRSLSEMR